MEKENNAVIPKKYPYVSFVTFKNALDAVTLIGVPPTIDRSVLQQFSGANQGLLLQAFRYLGFTNQNDESTAVFHKYAGAELDSEDQKVILGHLVKQCYPEQLKFLANGTMQNIKDTFNNTSVEASVKTKCLSFFLQTAKEAGLPISGHILKGARGNRGPRGPRKEGPKKTTKGKGQADSSGSGGSIDENETPKGMARVRISVGLNNEWAILMPENYTKDELERFLKVVHITLDKPK
jgi:hypothetical protein